MGHSQSKTTISAIGGAATAGLVLASSSTPVSASAASTSASSVSYNALNNSCESIDCTEVPRLRPPRDTDIWRQRRRQNRGLFLVAYDGGGVRGRVGIWISMEIYRQVLRRHPNVQFHELFDMAGGTSAGGHNVLGMFARHFSPEYCLQLYSQENMRKIFDPRLVFKALNVVNSLSRYNPKGLEEVLTKELGTNPLYTTEAPKVVVVAADMTEKKNAAPFLFRNWAYPRDHTPRPLRRGSCNVPIHIVGRITAAASSFFPGVKLQYFDQDGARSVSCADGGQAVNNPSEIVADEATTVWDLPIRVFVSIGTGKPPPTRNSEREDHTLGMIGGMISRATGVEETHRNMEARARQSNFEYFRFNPELPFDIPLDDTNPDTIQQLDDIVRDYLDQEHVQQKIVQLADLLVEEFIR